MKVINLFVLQLTCTILVSSYIFGCKSANSGTEERSKSNGMNIRPPSRPSLSVKKDASNQRLQHEVFVSSRFRKVDDSFFIDMGWKTTTPQPPVPEDLISRRIKPIILMAEPEERYMLIEMIRQVAEAKYNLTIDRYGRFNLTKSNIKKYGKLRKNLYLTPLA